METSFLFFRRSVHFNDWDFYSKRGVYSHEHYKLWLYFHFSQVFLFVSVFNIMESGKKLGVGSVAWHPRTSGSLSHMEDMLLPTSFPCLFANWENIRDHGRYWIWDVVKLSVINLTKNSRAYSFKRAGGGGHYERVNCHSLEEVLRPWLTIFSLAGEGSSHTQAETGLKERWHVFPVWLGLSSPFTKVKIP